MADILQKRLQKMEAQGEIEVMNINIDEDFQIMDDKDEEILLVLQEKYYVSLKVN